MTNLFFNLLICLSFASFAFAFRSHLRKGTQTSEKIMDDFLRTEHEASFITKKEFPVQLLITLDEEKIPYVEHDKCLPLYDKLKSFIEAPMVSLEGYTNLQLKQTFGINHFYKLIQYEETLLAFISQAYRYAITLEENDYLEEAYTLLHYMIENNWKSEKIIVAYKRIAGNMNMLKDNN